MRQRPITALFTGALYLIVGVSMEVVYQNLTPSIAEVFRGSISAYSSTIVVNAICIGIVACHLIIMITTKKFRQQYQTVTALSCIYVAILSSFVLEATTRMAFYQKSISDGAYPIVNSQECIKVWILLQAFGDLTAPILELVMSTERFLAVFSPKLYRRMAADNRATYTWITCSVTIGALCVIVPTLVSALWPTPNVKYDCGRRAALGVNFGLFDYGFNMIVYTVAFGINVRTYLKAKSVQQTSAGLKKLRLYTIIAGLSTALVAFPNACSFYANTVAFLPEVLMKYTNQLTSANCVLMFFVYLAMNPEYRQRCLSVVTCGHVNILPTFIVPTNISAADTKSVVATSKASNTGVR